MAHDTLKLRLFTWTVRPSHWPAPPSSVSPSLAPTPEQTWKHAHLEGVIRKGGDGQALEIINNMHRAVQLGHLCSLYQAHTLQIPTHVLAVSQGSSTWVSLVSSSRPSRCGCLRSTRCPAGLPSLSLSASPPPSLAHMQETTRCSSSARCHASFHVRTCSGGLR